MSKQKSNVNDDQDTFQVVTFHDRNVGREARHYANGKIRFKMNPAMEVLYPELCEEVEAQIKNGKTEGFTSDPCYPQWMVETREFTNTQ